MKPQVILGIVLIIAGAVLLSYRHFTTTESKPIVQSRDIQINLPVTEDHSIPPLVGWAVIGGGVVLLGLGLKGK